MEYYQKNINKTSSEGAFVQNIKFKLNLKNEDLVS